MKKNVILSMVIFSLLLGNNALSAKVIKKATSVLKKASIILLPPRQLVRSDTSEHPIFFIGGSLGLNDSVIAIDNITSLKGNEITAIDTASTFVSLEGSLTGIGTLSSAENKFTPEIDSQCLVDGKSPTTIIVQPSLGLNGKFLRSSGDGSAAGISLEGVNANVNLALSYIDTSVDLNGGSVILGQDLKFGDNSRFLNSGSIDLNGRSLIFGGKPMTWSTRVVWNNASDIQLNSRTTLDSTWYFDGDSRISGNGNILDISSGGNLWIKRNTELFLINMKIKGFGIGNIIFEDSTSKLVLSNVEMEMDDNVTVTAGGIYIDGPTTMITKDYLFTIDTAASMTVDGLTLWYNTMSYWDDNNIRPAIDDPANVNNKYLTLLNDGVVRHLNLGDSLRTNSNAIAYNGAIYAQHYIVANPVKTISNMAYLKEGFTIPDDRTLILNTPLRVSGNICLGDTGAGTLQLGGDLTLGADAYLTSAGIINGDGHSLKLTGSMVIPAAGDDLEFVGNTVFDGGGQVVSFEAGASLLVDAGVSVTLCNMILIVPSTDALNCADGTARLTLQDVTVCLESDYTFSTGRLCFDHEVTVNGSHSFTYASSYPMTIQKASLLFFDAGSGFDYAPGSDNRDLVRMIDQTSKLCLNGCTLSSTSTGLRLSKGTLILDNKNEIYADGATLSEAVSFGNGNAGDNLTIYMKPGASINAKTGCLDYGNVEDRS